jgi:ubiquitin-conjugating enzyme E2 I
MENRADGTTNMFKWLCEIPGPSNTPWEEGTYTLTIDFSHDFPVRLLKHYYRPPKCMFKPVLPHPNIYPSGTVCLSILND